MSNRRGFERADRVAQQVHEVIARLFLNEIKDPRLEEVEIRDVDMAPDLRNAWVYFTLIHGDDEPSTEVEEALDGVSGFVRSKLGEKLTMKYVPEVEFRFDESAVKGRRIDELLSDLRDD